MYFTLRWKLLETMCVSPHFFFAPALFEEKRLLCQSGLLGDYNVPSPLPNCDGHVESELSLLEASEIWGMFVTAP